MEITRISKFMFYYYLRINNLLLYLKKHNQTYILGNFWFRVVVTMTRNPLHIVHVVLNLLGNKNNTVADINISFQTLFSTEICLWKA